MKVTDGWLAAENYWRRDLLGRRADADFVYNFLVGQVAKRASLGKTASYVLNIDADWGAGKSFFLDGLALDMRAKGHIVARVNAWRDDHATDAYVAIMAAIDNAFQPYLKQSGLLSNAWSAAKQSGGAIALKAGAAFVKSYLTNKLGEDPAALLGSVLDEHALPTGVGKASSAAIAAGAAHMEKLFDASLDALISGFRKTDSAMSEFRSKLEVAVRTLQPDVQSPLFVLVDELDRCRPTYAVELLERVKHLFDVPGVVFIFATNTDQLQHSIGGAYGNSFDGMRYLKRFFERTYRFDTPETHLLVESIYENMPTNKMRAPEQNVLGALQAGCKYYGLDPRAIIQVLEIVDNVATAWPYHTPIEVVLLFPLCVEFYEKQAAVWPPYTNDTIRMWKLDRLKGRNTGQFVGQPLLYYEYYQALHGVVGSLLEASNLAGRTGASEAIRYAYQTFHPELSEPGRQSYQASVQNELPRLVMNAGRMSNLEEDDENEEDN